MNALKVMIVEDEAIAALATEMMLERLGCEICCNVSSGEEALEVLDSIRPDLLVMDVRLEGEMDGIETTEHIRRSHNIPVIYVTAYSDDTTQARAEATYPLAYLIKPLDMRLLEHALEQARDLRPKYASSPPGLGLKEEMP